jgi:hypothetical protein
MQGLTTSWEWLGPRKHRGSSLGSRLLAPNSTPIEHSQLETAPPRLPEVLPLTCRMYLFSVALAAAVNRKNMAKRTKDDLPPLTAKRESNAISRAGPNIQNIVESTIWVYALRIIKIDVGNGHPVRWQGPMRAMMMREQPTVSCGTGGTA